MSDSENTKRGMPRRELVMLLTLMLVQFTGIMDMIIVGPLELPLTRAFHESAAWFARSIFAFTLSSCAFNLAGASFVDRFDRKSVLLVTCAGFGLGQLACSLAPTADTFVLARVFAGAFAGIMSASATAIVGDLVPIERRGTASGVMNAAYALAFIVGVPLGLYLAHHFSWHAPFSMMAAQVLVVVALGLFTVPSARAHLERERTATPIRAILTDLAQLRSLGLNGGLMFSNYVVTPFLATYMVANLGFDSGAIPLFYLLGGLFTLVAVVLIGKQADRRGHRLVFIASTLASMLPALWITVLATRSLAVAIFAVTLYMATMTARTVPALAIAITTVPTALRGGFMSLNSALQQLSLGLGAMAGGAIIVEHGHGQPLARFGYCGVVSAIGTLVCVLLAWSLRDPPRAHTSAPAEQ